MAGLIGYDNYQEYKERLDAEWKNNEEQAVKLVEGFVRVGYLLKLARDTDILERSGYRNVNEFAQAEYGIDKTVVSRYMSINDRFSEGGNSELLKERYRGFGFAKLTIMLQLPEALTEELSPAYSKAEVQALKEEIDEEKKVTDLEVLLEGQEPGQEAMSSLEKALRQICRDLPELYVDLHGAWKEYGPSAGILQEILAPAGEKIYSVRVQGVGRLLLAVKDAGQALTLLNVRSNEKEIFSWEELLDAVGRMMDMDRTAEASWEAAYGMPFPREAEAARERRTMERRPSKVEKARTLERRPEPVRKDAAPAQQELEAERKEVAPVQPSESEEKRQETVSVQESEPGEQILGQMEVEDYPELLPEGMRQKPDMGSNGAPVEEKGENVENTVCEVESVEGEVRSEEELQAEALVIARKVVRVLEDYDRLPEEMAEACLAEAEILAATVRELYGAVQRRGSCAEAEHEEHTA